MSSLLLEKELENNWNDLIDKFQQKSLNISQFIRPYSTHSEKYIYSGGEKIHFNQRDSKFQVILRKEFVRAMKEFCNEWVIYAYLDLKKNSKREKNLNLHIQLIVKGRFYHIINMANQDDTSFLIETWRKIILGKEKKIKENLRNINILWL